MLLYHNRSVCRLIGQINGSVIFRWKSILPGLVLAAVAFLVAWLVEQESRWAPKIPNHYGVMSIGGVVTFTVVFRTNLGWQRYWEAVSQQHFMYSKWADAYSQFLAFANTTITQVEARGGDGSAAKVERVKTAIRMVRKNFSLLSALAAHRLSHGDIMRMEKRAEKAAWRDQIVMRRDLRTGADLTGATELPSFVEATNQISKSFRVQDLDPSWKSCYVVTELPTQKELHALTVVADPVAAVNYWIIQLFSGISKDLDIAPPIQSRMYQEISNGMLGYNNSLKLADVPFPLPYAQLVTIFLIAFSCFIPVYIAIFTTSLWASPVLAFLFFEGIWGINEIATELENPFGFDVNDISLSDFHGRFLEAITELSVVQDAQMPDVEVDAIPAERKASRTLHVELTTGQPAPVALDVRSDLESGIAERKAEVFSAPQAGAGSSVVFSPVPPPPVVVIMSAGKSPPDKCNVGASNSVSREKPELFQDNGLPKHTHTHNHTHTSTHRRVGHRQYDARHAVEPETVAHTSAHRGACNGSQA